MPRDKLSRCNNLNDKLRVIDADYRVKRFFRSSSQNAGLARVLLDSKSLFLIKCLVASGQEHVLCLSETVPELESPAMASGSVKSAFYALAKMIENIFQQFWCWIWEDGYGDEFGKTVADLCLKSQ
ncbi:hypothetical protein RYX36_023412 [Vicia faba]